MNPTLVKEIGENLEGRTNEELLAIWKDNNREEWREEAFEAIRIILLRRGLTVPDQVSYPSHPKIPLSVDPSITSSMISRYKDAYIVAKVTTGFGTLIKMVGTILALFIALVAFIAASQTSEGSQSIVTVVGIFSAIVVGFLFYLLGVLVAAQGQILKASLDGAVNSSPFLNNEHKVKVMSLL